MSHVKLEFEGEFKVRTVKNQLTFLQEFKVRTVKNQQNLRFVCESAIVGKPDKQKGPKTRLRFVHVKLEFEGEFKVRTLKNQLTFWRQKVTKAHGYLGESLPSSSNLVDLLQILLLYLNQLSSGNQTKKRPKNATPICSRKTRN